MKNLNRKIAFEQKLCLWLKNVELTTPGLQFEQIYLFTIPMYCRKILLDSKMRWEILEAGRIFLT